VSWRLGCCGVADTIEGSGDSGDSGSGVAAVMVAVGWTVCCMQAAAAVSSHEGSSAWLANAVLMCSGRVRGKMALNNTSPFAGMRA
jgi:hypothetical protein